MKQSLRCASRTTSRKLKDYGNRREIVFSFSNVVSPADLQKAFRAVDAVFRARRR